MQLRTFDPFYGGNPIKARRYGQVLRWALGSKRIRERWELEYLRKTSFRTGLPKIFLCSFRLLLVVNFSLQELHFKGG